MVYRYKIEDCINNGSISFSYDYDTGLTIMYKDNFGEEKTVVLDPKGDDYTIEETPSQNPDPDDPDNNDPNTPGGGDPDDPDNNDPNTKRSALLKRNRITIWINWDIARRLLILSMQ